MGYNGQCWVRIIGYANRFPEKYSCCTCAREKTLLPISEPLDNLTVSGWGRASLRDEERKGREGEGGRELVKRSQKVMSRPEVAGLSHILGQVPIRR